MDHNNMPGMDHSGMGTAASRLPSRAVPFGMLLVNTAQVLICVSIRHEPIWMTRVSGYVEMAAGY